MGGLWGPGGGLFISLTALLPTLLGAGARRSRRDGGDTAEGAAGRRRPWRWAGPAAGAAVAIGLVLLILGPAPEWLLEHVDLRNPPPPTGGEEAAPQEPPLDAKERLEALDAIRGRLMALGTGVLAAAALYYTAGNAASASRTADAAQHSAEAAQYSATVTAEAQTRTLELARQSQTTDRYTRAVEQLGSTTIPVRVGGVYALEGIARDSARDHPTVMAVLATFVREHSHDPDAHVHRYEDAPPRSRFRPDLQAALTVIGRRVTEHDLDPIDLTDADLSGARLAGANLPAARLTGTGLSGADLTGACLSGADLSRTDLSRANLSGASLPDADLTDAVLYRADLADADCAGAVLSGVNLTDANLVRADLRRADLRRADLTDDANLTDADLSGADLRCVRGRAPEQIRAVAVTDEHTRF